MRYRGKNISSEKYKEVRDRIYEIIFEICESEQISINDLSNSDIQKYFENNFDYEYLPYEFSDKMSSYFMGDLTISEDLTIIGYNTNKKISMERQNFTKMHETAHSILHKKHSPIIQRFSEISELKGYSEKDQQLEIEADLGASILMLNDHALYNCIFLCESFHSICERFSISKTALKLRVKNFLEYNCKLDFSTADSFSMYYMTNANILKNFLQNQKIEVIL